MGIRKSINDQIYEIYLAATGQTTGAASTASAIEEKLNGTINTSLDKRSSTTQALIDGVSFFFKATAPATALKYTAIQLWNPIDSDSVFILGPINGYNSTGTMIWTRIKPTEALPNLIGDSQNTNFHSSTVSKLKMYYDALTTLSPSSDFGKPSIATTGGTGSAATSGQYILYPGQGFQLEGNTVNVGMSILGNITEIPLSEFLASLD